MPLPSLWYHPCDICCRYGLHFLAILTVICIPELGGITSHGWRPYTRPTRYDDKCTEVVAVSRSICRLEKAVWSCCPAEEGWCLGAWAEDAHAWAGGRLVCLLPGCGLTKPCCAQAGALLTLKRFSKQGEGFTCSYWCCLLNLTAHTLFKVWKLFWKGSAIKTLLALTWIRNERRVKKAKGKTILSGTPHMRDTGALEEVIDRIDRDQLCSTGPGASLEELGISAEHWATCSQGLPLFSGCCFHTNFATTSCFSAGLSYTNIPVLFGFCRLRISNVSTTSSGSRTCTRWSPSRSPWRATGCWRRMAENWGRSRLRPPRPAWRSWTYQSLTRVQAALLVADTWATSSGGLTRASRTRCRWRSGSTQSTVWKHGRGCCPSQGSRRLVMARTVESSGGTRFLLCSW